MQLDPQINFYEVCIINNWPHDIGLDFNSLFSSSLSKKIKKDKPADYKRRNLAYESDKDST